MPDINSKKWYNDRGGEFLLLLNFSESSEDESSWALTEFHVGIFFAQWKPDITGMVGPEENPC